MAREPVGVAWTGDELIVVCQDGSVWRSPDVRAPWIEAKAIPGTARHISSDPQGNAFLQEDSEKIRTLHAADEGGRPGKGRARSEYDPFAEDR